MTDPSIALQAALVAALKGITGLSFGIYDQVPSESKYPYAVLSRIAIADQSTEGCFDGAEATVTIHLLDNEKVGSVRPKQIGAAIVAAIDGDIAITGFRVVVHELMSADYGVDPDVPALRGTLVQRYELAAAA